MNISNTASPIPPPTTYTAREADGATRAKGSVAAPASADLRQHGHRAGEEDRSAVQRRAFASSRAAETELPPEEKAQIEQLKRRDREVRAHEAAHVSAAGAYVQGGASYTYSAGPDGKRYAVGGEVSIDTSPVPNDPEATIAKMQTVRRAALAPAQPSGQDLSVAARASQAEMQARAEAVEQAGAERAGEMSGEEAPQREEPAAPDRGLSPTEAVGPTDAKPAVGTRLDAYA